MLRECYATAFRFDPDTKGRVLVDVSRGADGSVVGARALCSSASALLTACTLDAVRAMDFGPAYPPGTKSTSVQPVVVSYLPIGDDPSSLTCPDIDAAHTDARAENPDDVVAWNRFRLMRCIDRSEGTVAGTARIRVDIDEAGKGHPKIVCTNVPEPLTACLLDAFAVMRFAKSAAGKSFVTPVVVPSSTSTAKDC